MDSAGAREREGEGETGRDWERVSSCSDSDDGATVEKRTSSDK